MLSCSVSPPILLSFAVTALFIRLSRRGSTLCSNYATRYKEQHSKYPNSLHKVFYNHSPAHTSMQALANLEKFTP